MAQANRCESFPTEISLVGPFQAIHCCCCFCFYYVSYLFECGCYCFYCCCWLNDIYFQLFVPSSWRISFKTNEEKCFPYVCIALIRCYAVNKTVCLKIIKIFNGNLVICWKGLQTFNGVDCIAGSCCGRICFTFCSTVHLQ